MLTQIYKPGQGKYTRLGTRFRRGDRSWRVGCYRLYQMLDGAPT